MKVNHIMKLWLSLPALAAGLCAVATPAAAANYRQSAVNTAEPTACQQALGGVFSDSSHISGKEYIDGTRVSSIDNSCLRYNSETRASAPEANHSPAMFVGFNLAGSNFAGAAVSKSTITPDQLPTLAKAKLVNGVTLRGGSYDVAINYIEARELIDQNAVRQKQMAKPSFDCAKAASVLEKYICGKNQNDVRALDRDVAGLYTQAMKGGKWNRDRQRTWLLERDKCAVAADKELCLLNSYGAVKEKLIAATGETNWLNKGDSALFTSETLALPASYSSTPLFAKITPVLVGGARTAIIVDRNAGGLYSITGSSLGGNAHSCTADATDLFFDSTTGWYSKASKGLNAPIFRVFNGRLEIFADGRPDYDKYPGASLSIGCGARAGFGETRRITIDAAKLKQVRANIEEANRP